MDPRIIKKTQDTLGKVIKKPPLTDKLLSKPPFRFLHDIMTSVMKQTGLMKGLFAEAELNSENVKEKDSKISFLQKSIDFISFVNGKSLGAKPSKIVAGHEPEKTNEFLQAIAAAINAKVDNDEYVNRFLNKGSSKEKEKPKEKDDRRKREKETEEKRDRQKSRDRERDRSRDREKDERHDREKSKEHDREERHRDRDERHRDRDERHKDRRKKVVSNDPDTLDEFLCADDDRLEDNTDTDLEMLADLSEMDSPIQRPDTHPHKILNSKERELDNSTPHPNIKEIKKGAKLYKTPKASRPGAARPTENRRPDQSYSNNEVDKQAIAQRSDQTHDSDCMSGKFIDVKGKKRKSGTKSRMSLRPKHDMESVVSLHSDRLKSHDNGSTTMPKHDTHSPVKDLPGKGKKKSSRESLLHDEKLNKTASGKVIRRNKLKNTVSLPESTLKSSPSKSKGHQVPGPLKGTYSSHHSSDVERRAKIHPELTEKTQKQKLQHREEEDHKESEAMVNGDKADGSESKIARPSSAKGSRRRREGRHQGSSDEEDEIPQTRPAQPTQQPTVGEEDLPPQVAASRKLSRPSSARPAPPRRKQETIENEPAMRLGSGKPANVIVDADKDSDDDDDNFVVEESAPPPPPEPEQTVKPEDSDEEDHGGLVKKILETKKELEGGNQPQQTKRTEVGKPYGRKGTKERPTMSDAQRRKQREQVQKEIDKLRGSIQTLTRSANPLGKIMDYVQEDLDSMQKELERWKSENKEHTLALKRERGITDKAIEPLKAQLSEVDQAIKDQLDLIAAVKSNIIRNEQKTEKMLRSIAKS